MVSFAEGGTTIGCLFNKYNFTVFDANGNAEILYGIDGAFGFDNIKEFMTACVMPRSKGLLYGHVECRGGQEFAEPSG
jgi:hypothetical protein